MSIQELLPTIRNLSHADKLRLVQCLVADLAHEEGILSTAEQQPVYDVWTPLHAYDAAASLLQALEQEKSAAK